MFALVLCASLLAIRRVCLSHRPLAPRLQPRDPKSDPTVTEAKNLMRRKRIQLEYAREYDDAVVELKQKVSGQWWRGA